MLRKVVSLIVMFSSFVSMQAYEFTDNGLVFKWVVGDKVGLNGINSLPSDGKLIIPSNASDYGEIQDVTHILEGLRYDEKGSSLVKSCVIPETITHIESWAFSSCINMTKLEYNIPKISFFGASLWNSHDSPFPPTISTVIIGSNVVSIPNAFLANDDALETINLPNNIKEIGNSAFYGCQGLREIELGNGVTTIGRYAFAQSKNIKELISSSLIPPVIYNDDTFEQEVYDNCILYVPFESLDKYKTADGWKNFFNIRPIGEIFAESISLNCAELSLYPSETFLLTATVTPDNTTDKTVTWKSDNEAIAKVEADGTVAAASVGVANITAACGDVSATCKVTVNPVTATTVTIDVPDTEIYVGDKVTLSATVAPDNTTDKNITWSCSTPEIATIDGQSGELTALAPGEAKITATCGDIRGTATVTVKPILATGLTLSAQDMTLFIGQTGNLTATVTPNNTTDKTVTWKSDNEAIAKVEADGTVAAVSVGVANITAACGDVSATCKVTVNARPKTPKQYVRKGNGKSCIFVVMMNLTDKELTQQGCRFAYGYTDTQGDEHILATSNHRYCHTSEQIYNDASNDFWVVAYWDKDNSIVTSVRRHLDGTTDDDFDQSILTNYLTRPIDSSDPDNWIRPTSRGAQISISSTEPTTVAIYNLNGVIIHCSNYERSTEVSEDIILDRYISNTYIITVQSGDIKSTKKIIIR